MPSVRYFSTAELPALHLWIYDDDGSLIDFSSGFTFVLKLGQAGSAAVLTKSSGITGAAGAGSEPDGTPNLVISWSAGELAVTAANYLAQLTATSGGLDRVFAFPFEVRSVVT